MPKSQTAASSASGLAGRSGSSGIRSRIQTRPGPRENGSVSQRMSIAVAKLGAAGSSSAKRTALPSCGPGMSSRGGRSCSPVGSRCGRSAASACTRSALALQTSVSSLRNSADISWTLRPGRTTSVLRLSGFEGTGRRNWNESRAVRSAGVGCRRSISSTISAAAAPPCSAPGSHGPRANGVGTKRPSCAAKMLCISLKPAGWPRSRRFGPGRAAARRAQSRPAPVAAPPAGGRRRGCARGPA